MAKVACFVGASTTEGMGDPEGLGWAGRLRRIEAQAGRPFLAYNLGVRGHSTGMIAGRWRRECAARLPDTADGLLVMSFGNNDAAALPDGTLRTPLDETLRNAEAVIAEAAAWRPTLWIGPTAVDEARMPVHSRLLGVDLSYDNRRLAEMSAAFAGIAGRLGVPYLDFHARLATDADWMAAVGRSDGLHPDGSGYDAAARHVAAWPSWQAALQA
ncbi:GDSL-type esterase/lipase family protein [Salinarimonas soli]|uniref:GDSL family lipase n=1 Tax=Salinarimonas soli TaxID=1638099 RepID=A0A5B2UZU7_9HYPH|nr:GDSL-type esterase/lipase family protein [Salinarimonas soli]KAA2231565.1 GDSL family lipase [Salinarimonas soli]